MIKPFLVFFAVSGLLLGQSTFPTAVDSPQSLTQATNNYTARLSQTVDNSGLTIHVTGQTTTLQNYSVVVIDSEEIQICSSSPTLLTVCTGGRGIDGTSASGHIINAMVYGRVTALQHNALVSAIINTQNFVKTLVLGSGVTSVGLTMPSIFSVSIPTITSTGIFGVTLNTQTANTLFMGPASGSPGVPSFRSLGGADLPFPGNSSLGGVQANTCVNQVLVSLSLSGILGCNPVTSAMTTGTFPASGHNLLSATHNDTTASAPVRGGGIFAVGVGATWTQVAHPSVSGGYFKWNGTDITASTLAASGTGTCTGQVVTATNADAAPTCGPVSNAMLSNSQITITPSSPLGGGGPVSLGGTVNLTCSSCSGGNSGITREIVIPVGGGSRLVTHNLGTTTPGISLVVVNSGCGNCFSVGNFTSNTFTVTSSQATDLVFAISFAPSNIVSFGVDINPVSSFSFRNSTAAVYTLIATPGFGFSGTITPTCGSFITIGSGISCAFSPSTLTSGGNWTSTLTISATGGATTGSGTYIISGTDGSTTQTTFPNAITVTDGVSRSNTFFDNGGGGSDQASYTTPSHTYSAHQTIIFGGFLCTNISCVAACNDPSTGFTVTDTMGDTFIAIPTAFVNNPTWCGYIWYVPNAIGGTGTITISSNAAHIWYMQNIISTFAGANQSTPIDTNISNSLHTVGGSLNLTSAGNIQSGGELAYGLVGTANTVTLSGSFSAISGSLGAGGVAVSAVNPTIGSPVILTGTQTPGFISALMISLKP